MKHSLESGYESATWLLTARPNITAIIAMSTLNARGALRAVAELGLSLPADVSLVTVDDHAFAEFMEVRLSTVSQRVTELGRIAANLIMERLKTGKRKIMYIVPVDFVQRASIRDLRIEASDPH